MPRGQIGLRYEPVQVAQVKALACTLPAETGLPLTRWSSAELAAEVIDRGMADRISPSHGPPLARRGRDQALAAPVLIFPRDPDFEAKAARVLDLYARCFGRGRRWARTST